MTRFAVVALVAFLLPAVAYYLWRAYAPERFGGSRALARGELSAMPWRKLAYAGLALVVASIAVFVSFDDVADEARAPSTAPLQGVATPQAR